jgi:MHS family proline/betaine transporter-like MFS transporter
MEWYDFSVYALFAIYIAQSAFANGDGVSALIHAFLAFGVGFVVRPIGALVLGAYADRAGRKAALTLSLGVMALGTLLIAIAPSYAAIGLGAPLLVMCGRLLQGFSAGGEIGGAASFLVEHAPAAQRGRFAAWLQSSMAISNILGAGVAAGLSFLLTPQQIADWGWRVPFVIGLAIAPVGLWLRATVRETPAFEAERRRMARPGPGLIDKLREVVAGEWRALLQAVGLSIVWIVAVYTLVIYMPTYAQRSLGFTAREAFTASVIGNVVMALVCLVSGRLSDRIGRRRMLSCGALLLLFLPLPVLGWLVRDDGVAALVIGQTVFCAGVAVFSGVAPAAVAELFPTRLRSTGVALAYNVAATMFGGFAPALLTFLTDRLHSPMAPAVYVMSAAVISLLTLATMRGDTGEGQRP